MAMIIDPIIYTKCRAYRPIDFSYLFNKTINEMNWNKLLIDNEWIKISSTSVGFNFGMQNIMRSTRNLIGSNIIDIASKQIRFNEWINFTVLIIVTSKINLTINWIKTIEYAEHPICGKAESCPGRLLPNSKYINRLDFYNI